MFMMPRRLYCVLQSTSLLDADAGNPLRRWKEAERRFGLGGGLFMAQWIFNWLRFLESPNCSGRRVRLNSFCVHKKASVKMLSLDTLARRLKVGKKAFSRRQMESLELSVPHARERVGELEERDEICTFLCCGMMT